MSSLNQQLTILTVTYNSSFVIKEFLDSVSDLCPIIIVDNNSQDSTQDIVLQEYPLVNFLSTGKNIGFGRGVNFGMNHIKTKYALVLNPDLKISKTAIEKMLLTIEAYPEAAIVSCATDTSEYLPESTEVYDRQTVIGAVMLFDREKFNQCGGFDENIFLYFEEIDLCKRIVEQGHRILFCPGVLLEHVGCGSSGHSEYVSALRSWHMAWSKAYFLRKHHFHAKLFKEYSLIFPARLCKRLWYWLTNNRDMFNKYRASTNGTWNSLIGRKAFDQNDNPKSIH